MNTSFYAIIYPFIHKISLSCYLRYIYHLKLSHFSKVYVPSYSFHEGLGHDLMLIGLNIYFFSHFTHLLCLFPSMSNCKTLFTRPLPANYIYLA